MSAIKSSSLNVFRVKNPQLIIASVFLVLLMTSTAEANVRLCGPRLTSALLAMCRNKLCAPAPIKVYNKRGGSPWNPRAEFYEIHRQTKRAGIATECCEKRCSFQFLKSFCCED